MTGTDYTQPETMQPSSQVLLLYYIYRNIDRLYLSDAVQELGYSAMTISRAARQLADLGLMLECKNGVQKIIYTENSHRDLFQQALPYLSTPVKWECYVSTNTNLSPHLLAGISALAEHSMLNPEHPICYRMYYKAKIAGTSQLIDAGQQYKIQLWKYDPELFRAWMIGNTVDPLSLYLSLNDHPDERIEEALEEYIENFWEEHI